ncbi:hypothetical protein [Dactylosporangium sp. NPDC051484]|uniref:hypothetical protein n=1 Tax=Dactylosporangium sp. NPDC051484 TaxID=3154942 RepID=UPI0034507175
MSASFSEWMRSAFSEPRLEAYTAAANQDANTAERLYWWNIEISAAFYGPLHCLELVLRNALDVQLRSAYARDTWWDNAPLTASGMRMVTDAHEKCRRRGARHVAADDIIAELPFGFWTSLLSNSRGSRYDRQLWVPTLHRAFPYYHGRRGDLHDNLEAMRLLRNRIMHHEPIHHRDLAADHRKIYRLINFINTTAAKESLAMDRVPTVLGHRQAVCDGSRPPRF